MTRAPSALAADQIGSTFVELDRTFHELSQAPESDDSDINRLFQTGAGLSWTELLRDYRVVILSEAGTGKTEEIRNVARKLRSEGKSAFFVRLEHVRDDFETSFEEGTFEEFQEWIADGSEGWLLLDSVDEARLRNPRDFETAVRRLGHWLDAARQRVHIVITGRTTAWRPNTDLALCSKHLPFEDLDVDFRS